MATLYQAHHALSIQSETSLNSWLTLAGERSQLPAGYRALDACLKTPPVQRAIRPDLLPLCQHIALPASYLCAQLSPMGRVSAYGEWCDVNGWTPWSAHWEAILVALWAKAVLQQEPDLAEHTAWIGAFWPAVQAHFPGLPEWSVMRDLRGPLPLMTLLERGVAAYPVVLWLSDYADRATGETVMPDNLVPLLSRERCRLWRTIDPQENSLQRVVKAVYAVQAMRRGEFDCRTSESPYALNLCAVLQEHWTQVPEPLRDDHLIKAARDGRLPILVQAWQTEAEDCRRRLHFTEAYWASAQVWSLAPESVSPELMQRWEADTEHAESDCWAKMLHWHRFS